MSKIGRCCSVRVLATPVSLRVCSNSCSLSPGMLSNHLILCRPLLYPSSRGAVNQGSQGGREWRGGSHRARKGDTRVGTLAYRAISCWERKGTPSDWASVVAQLVRNPLAKRETWVRSLGWEDPRVGKIPWRRACQPTPVFLPGEPHGQRSLVGLQSTGLQRFGHD